MCAALFKVVIFLFLQLFLIIVHLRNLFLLSTPDARMLLTPTADEKMWNSYINISKLTAANKHSISSRTKFSHNHHVVGEETFFLSLHLDMVWTDLHSHMPLQQEIGFYIPLESTCCLFAAYCHKLLNRESYDGCFTCSKRSLKISYLTY